MKLPRVSRTDVRLITPYLDIWNEFVSRIPPDTIHTKAQLTDDMMSELQEGAYREQVTGALIRYSISRGDLSKIGTEHYVKIGVSRESVIALSQHVSLAGLFVEEESPGTFLGYEDLAWADGRTERHYTVFARSVGETMRWGIFSVAIIVPWVDGRPEWDDRTRGFMVKRLDTLALM